jgi:hypothetical protein
MEVKVGYWSAMGPDDIWKTRGLRWIISFVEGRDPMPDIGILTALEVVQQRRRDALRITELTLRATEALEKLNNN